MEKITLIKISFIALVIAICTTSCVSKKDIIYVQDIDTALSDSQSSKYDAVITSDDILKIIVTSENMESVQPFNQVVSPVVNQELSIRSQETLQSYLVDDEGFINYPLLGKLKASGYTRIELQDHLKNEMLKYVKDAVVDVRILNYKITLLGEVNRPGTYKVDDNRITLLQALGLAGDLTVYGRRDNILVLRDMNGIQTSTRVDLTSADFIYSPFYYLNQNDTIIVEPNGAQIQASGFNRNISVYVSIASLLLTTVVVFSNLNK
ncbi:polysaccharide biosynthesis/export family protein [Nonlabens mediterrranea]|uniref:Polysaccharide biosynthesis/export family protein n=1 Tax=Nonlabens mediterrranea TaxID=1419947 RepID=A0ABS0A464_9FLAO|nr:polysaccharide biosynthesis/export family protein [Nonlabens mediterrranea]